MKCFSTRGGQETDGAASAIIQGIADDKGLFVPAEIPTLDISFRELSEMRYQNVAKLIIGKFFDDFTYEEIVGCDADERRERCRIHRRDLSLSFDGNQRIPKGPDLLTCLGWPLTPVNVTHTTMLHRYAYIRCIIYTQQEVNDAIRIRPEQERCKFG